MSSNLTAWGRRVALSVALGAVLLGSWRAAITSPSASERLGNTATGLMDDLVQGENNTVLFMTTELYGLSTVHLATVYALIERHPQVNIHYASFPALSDRVARTAKLAARNSGSASAASRAAAVEFHQLEGESYGVALLDGLPGRSLALRHEPGFAGGAAMCFLLNLTMDPWHFDDHARQYMSARKVIEEINPSLVVTETMMIPGIEAIRDTRRRYAVLTPNILGGITPAVQPLHTMLWKYPSIGSGFSFPMKWQAVPTNVYLTYKMISCLWAKSRNDRTDELKARGVENPINMLSLYDREIPYITQTLPDAHFPVDVLPDNILLAGPINLAGVEDTSSADASELRAWVNRAPTIMINLGSVFELTETQLYSMAEAIAILFAQATDVQVLWKAKLTKDVNPSVLDDVRATMDPNHVHRLRIEAWLHVEPPTLLLEEGIVAYVHHGGAGSFHDALGAGVPHVVLPQWADLYDYATVAEFLNIGVWPCQHLSPDWEPECLARGFLEVLASTPSGIQMRTNASSMGSKARARPGRNVAAAEIARLASILPSADV